ncbi:hypothetical protein ACFOW1_06300 [Parasediminibacterium paludis]|uniref:LTXXQ motif family protein n=1 Tax=Parasediminibacterium paludis TaxID=908966 RepID=A0ABV8PXJ1_9BACT
MNKKHIIIVILLVASHVCLSQTVDTTVIKAKTEAEIKFLKARFAIDSVQTIKLYAKLYNFYANKEAGEHNKSRATIENTQNAYETLLKKELTDAQFKKYNDLRKQHQQLYEQRIQRKHGVDSTHH